MSTLHLINETLTIQPMSANGGLFDLGISKLTDLTTMLKLVASAAVIYFLIKTAFNTGGALAAIVVAGISGAIFLYFVNHVGDVQDRVDNEVNSAPATVQLHELHTAAAKNALSDRAWSTSPAATLSTWL